MIVGGGEKGPRNLSRAPEAPGGRFARASDLVLLAALSGWLAAVGLARPDLAEPDEPRSAMVARLMVERGDWLAPHLPAVFRHTHPARPLDGDLFPYWDKPPLYFWLSAAAMKVLGPSALAARLPSAVGHVAATLLVYAAGRRLWGRRGGLLAGAVMATALLPVIMAHVARMESLLAALLALALLAILRLFDGPTGRRRWAWTIILYGALGLGVLAKGPVALAVAGGAVLVTAALAGRWRDLARLRPLEGAAIVALVAAPWFIYMSLRFPGSTEGGPGFLRDFFIGEHVARAMTPHFGHRRVPGYLLGVLLLGFAFWSLFLPGACRRTLAAAWRGRCEGAGPLLCFVWPGLVVLVFSLGRTQMPHYVLPAFPALAVALGGYLAEALGRVPRDRWLVGGLWASLPLGAAAAVALAVLHVDRGGGLAAAGVFAAAMAAVLAASAACLLRRREDLSLALAPAGMAMLLTFLFATDPLGVYENLTARREAQMIQESVRPGDAVLSFGHTPYSLAWHLWPREVPYPTATGSLRGKPNLEALVAELNLPRRTFCLLRKRAFLEVVRPRVRWPIKVLSQSERYMLILTAPPDAPPASQEAPGAAPLGTPDPPLATPLPRLTSPAARPPS